jgi:hypothetical protein
MENDTQLEEKVYDEDLDNRVGKPGVVRLKEILSTFSLRCEVDVEFDPKETLCKGDVRVISLPNLDADLIFEVEVRMEHYDAVLSGEFQTAHVLSRKANEKNTADINISFDKDLKRFYAFSMDVARKFPIDQTGRAKNGAGKVVRQSWANVPRKYIGFFSIDYDNKVIKPELIGPNYTYSQYMWVPLGCRESNGLATKRICRRS